MKRSTTLKLILFVFATALASTSMAAGVINLKGKIRSFSETELQIGSGDQIFTLEKKSIREDVLKSLESKKSGEAVDVWVYFTSIRDVRREKKKN